MKDIAISSPWGGTSGDEPPLNDYPRPALVRGEWMNLNGYWDYTIRPKSAGAAIPAAWEGKILVPFAVETPLSGVRRTINPDDQLWYRRRFVVPEGWNGRKIRLNFEAVDYICRCYVNGKLVGEHRGGYLPFGFDITGALGPGKNVIALCVEDPTDAGMQPRGKQTAAPKKIWYEATTGIWQTVWLEPVSREGFIVDVGGSWSEKDRRLTLAISSETEDIGDFSFGVELRDPAGERIAEIRSSESTVDVEISEPRLWSPKNPVLYGIGLRLYRGKTLVDEVESYTALRTVDSAPGAGGRRRIRLNGEPIFVNGLLDQGYWPESGLTAPDDAALIFDIEETKKIGFNCLRKHIKIESRRWYYHADRLGMLVMQDMVSGGLNWTNAVLQILLRPRRKDSGRAAYRRSGRKEEKIRKEFERSVEDTVAHLCRHPSIIAWVPFNESWGQFDAARIGERVEALDPTRLVDCTSGWVDQGGGDFYSVHRYSIKLRAAPRREKRIHIISEYGGYALPVPGHLWDERTEYGYQSYTSREQLADAYASLIRSQVIPLISRGLSGAVYTQVSDVETEINGLFSYDRKVLKIDGKLLENLNREIYAAFETLETMSGTGGSQTENG